MNVTRGGGRRARAALPVDGPFDVIVLSGSVAEVPRTLLASSSRRPADRDRRPAADHARGPGDARHDAGLRDGRAVRHRRAAPDGFGEPTPLRLLSACDGRRSSHQRPSRPPARAAVAPPIARGTLARLATRAPRADVALPAKHPGNLHASLELNRQASRMRSATPPCPSPAPAVSAALAPVASAQSLLELYEAAHGYDATYLAARALADRRVSGRADRALMRPSARSRRDAGEQHPTCPNSAATRSARLNGRQPLFNRANDADDRAGRASLDVSLADLDTAEQDLILRVSQAYFDVLGAQDTLRDDARQQGGDRRAAGVGASATSRSAPRPSPTPARRRRASTWRRRRRSPPRTTSSPSGSPSTSWSAAPTSSRSQLAVPVVLPALGAGRAEPG